MTVHHKFWHDKPRCKDWKFNESIYFDLKYTTCPICLLEFEKDKLIKLLLKP